MASPKKSEDQLPIIGEQALGGQEQGQGQQIPRYELDDTVQLPLKAKEKKKVGFVGDTQHRQTGSADDITFQTTQLNQTTPNEQPYAGADYFSSPGSEADHASPGPRLNLPGNRDSFNKDELAAALAQILKPEHHGGPSRPSRPRPVLRKQTVVDDPVEMTAPRRSELEARSRADKLAHAVGSSSLPPSATQSRRNSFDQPESGTQTPFDEDSLLQVPGQQREDTSRGLFSGGLRARKGGQQTANELVRSHTGRNNRQVSPLIQSSTVPRSGTATPVPDDIEYVPRPEKYKGGVLGSLLKLYNTNTESKKDTDSASFMTTPSRTPNRTPSSTPPTSRPSTPQPGNRLSRPGMGRRPVSSSTLAGLMESSFIFAAPGGTKDISEAVSDKLKSESYNNLKNASKKRSRSRQKEEYRITVHIAQIINRHRYLVKLCRALMMYGAPTHRLEGYMMMSARVLGIEGQFMYLPGTMIISFDDSNTHTTEMKIVRSPQGVDLGRLRDVHEIYKEVVHDRIGVEEATSRLEAVISLPPKFPTWLRLLLYGLASAFVAPFGFEGRYIDMPIAVLLGCLVGYLQLYLAPSNELYANVFEITAAVATSFLARVFGSIRGGELFCFSALAQSSIALILPGYMVLSASLELQSHQMISGSVRMVYALIYSLFLGYGITIGSVIYGYLDSNAVSAVHCSTGDAWYLQRPHQNFYLLFVFPFTLCLCAINQAKWKQTPVMVVISLAGYCVNNFSSRYFSGNSTLSSSLGALCVGVLANLYSRLGRYVKNYMLDVWEGQIEPRMQRLLKKRRPYYFNESSEDIAKGVNESSEGEFAQTRTKENGDDDDDDDEDPELGLGKEAKRPITARVRQIGFGLAAAAMLPAIFVQVPSGLAVSGSLLSGVTEADQIVRNETALANGTSVMTTLSERGTGGTNLNNTAFNVLFSVIQVAISVSVGLSLSALIVYPFGKRRSGLFSF